ncbi:MAG TPA: dephospho-CoA kinase [Nevskiaceae bacterium]|nr:dephospho-CoA kinase [Nevskiaceae bacterium]
MPALTIGLTGGIASGKTLVADAFAALGVPVCDADQVARAVVAPSTEGLAEIVKGFGPAVLLPDGSLDRRRMREIVFNDPEARRDLEAITHPRIHAQMRTWRDAQSTPYCMLVIPLLLEKGENPLVDRVLVVDAAEEAQLLRLVQRDRISIELAREIMAAQLSRHRRLALAQDVIDNTGAAADVRSQVADLHRRYLALAASEPRGR